MKQDRDEQFIPQQPAFNDGRSSLSDFLWQEQAAGRRQQADAHAAPLNAISTAVRHTEAIREGSLRGEEYYTQSEPMLGREKLCQSDAAVESRQISKEEFPQG